MAIYDVVKNYDWTSAPRGSYYRSNAPKIWLKSHKLISNQIMSAINGYIAIGVNVNKSAEEFYDQLYGESTEREDDFLFPYFSDGVRGFGNTFGDTFQSALGGSGGTLADVNQGFTKFVGGGADAYNVGKASFNAAGSAGKALGSMDWGDAKMHMSQARSEYNAGGSPGSYIETPMFYQYEKNDSTVDVSMILVNTLNEDAYLDNMDLVNKLTIINRPLRKTSISVEPPRIYTLRVQGLRYIKWAYCSNFNVSMLGMKREIDGVIVPEAYQIDMSFQSLTMEHAGFMDRIIS